MKTKQLSILALAALAAAVVASPAKVRDDTSAFAQIKSLAGIWKGTGAAEGAPEPMSVRYRVVSGGSAVEETIAPGTPHEMVTMFYLDGKTLTLTHYCVLGNQPRMKLAADSSAKELKFAFDGGANCSADGPYMSSVAFTWISPKHLKTRWGMTAGGKETGCIQMDLTRQP